MSYYQGITLLMRPKWASWKASTSSTWMQCRACGKSRSAGQSMRVWRNSWSPRRGKWRRRGLSLISRESGWWPGLRRCMTWSLAEKNLWAKHTHIHYYAHVHNHTHTVNLYLPFSGSKRWILVNLGEMWYVVFKSILFVCACVFSDFRASPTTKPSPATTTPTPSAGPSCARHSRRLQGCQSQHLPSGTHWIQHHGMGHRTILGTVSVLDYMWPVLVSCSLLFNSE